MNQSLIEAIEHITQLRISNFIKKNRGIDKKELVEKIEEILDEKDKMYTMSEKEVEEILKNKKKDE